MKMQRIVVGVDGSNEAARALTWASDLALLTGAEVTAVTVFDAGPYVSAGDAAYVPSFDHLRAHLLADLEAWCEPLRLSGVVHDLVVREGTAAAELIHEADAKPTDLIVVGSRGRGGFRELLLGSVAHNLTHHAKQPVLVVPRQAVRSEQEAGALAASGAPA